jgi:hypothetical protein
MTDIAPVDPRLLTLLHHPETATDWQDYVSRFVDAPFRPDDDDRHDEGGFFFMSWMVVGMQNGPESHWLSWLDLWIFFTLVRGVPMSVARHGPDQGWELRREFWARAVRFGL